MASKILKSFTHRTKWIFSSNSNHSTGFFTQQSSVNVRTKSDGKIISCSTEIGNLDNVTMPELLWSNIGKWENATAFECAVTGRKYTHGQIYKQSRSFATALLQSGLKRGDVVGIALPNLPEFPTAITGVLEAGMIVSPINPVYSSVEIAKQMTDCEAKTIITIPELLDQIKAAQKSCPNLKNIIIIGETPKGCHSFFEMTKVNSTGTEFLKGSQITNDTVAFIPYSSGTTGPPKGVMLTHKNLSSNILQINHPGVHITLPNEGGNGQDRLVAVIPFFHIYGLNVILSTVLYQGHHVSCLAKFVPDDFIALIRKHKPTVMHLVPPLLSFLVQNPNIRKKELGAIRGIVGGAAPIGLAVINGLLEKVGRYFCFQEGYGMTEMSPVSHMLQPKYKNAKLGSCGNPVPQTQCKIVDEKTGEPLGPNQRGELLVKGPQVMKGYLKNEKATNETITSDGWLRTGDIGLYDEDECFYIVDRLKELIKVKGFQVAPSELEDLLRQHPEVADVAVIGIPDDRSGELPRAYIVKQQNSSLSEQDVHKHIQDKVAPFKYLEGGVEFLDAIPKAASGKILRRELKANFLSKK